jgi:two-component system sensor histidine kinase FlrB
MSQLVSAPGQTQSPGAASAGTFDAFNQVSQALTQAYQGLQGRVESLTAELAVANGSCAGSTRRRKRFPNVCRCCSTPCRPGWWCSTARARLAKPTRRPARCSVRRSSAKPGRLWCRARLVATEAPVSGSLESRRLAIVESPLDSAGGRILLIHDVTAAHGLKAELERNQRLVAMGEMAASLAHQLRTPLATALLYSANLGQPAHADAARVRFADKTTAQLKRLERLIQEVLLFARGREHRPRYDLCRATACRRCADRQTPVFGERSRFPGHLQRWRRVPHWQPEGLAGALVNLLENALQACAAGGKVILGAEAVRSTAAHRCPRYRFRDLPRSRRAFSSRSLRRAGRAPASVWRSPSASRVHTGVPSM